MGRRSVCGIVLALALCASPAPAIATSRAFSLRVRVPSGVKRNQPFTITASGTAPRRTHLVFFLSQQSCQSSYVLEYNDIGALSPGYPYFQRGHEFGSKADVSATYTVKGAFTARVTAHARSKTGAEYVCAYLPAQNPQRTHAHATARYSVAP